MDAEASWEDPNWELDNIILVRLQSSLAYLKERKVIFQCRHIKAIADSFQEDLKTAALEEKITVLLEIIDDCNFHIRRIQDQIAEILSRKSKDPRLPMSLEAVTIAVQIEGPSDDDHQLKQQHRRRIDAVQL